MSNEEHGAYYSKRMRIADVTSPVACLGMKERTLEVTIGNTTNPVVFNNPKDVADIKNQDMKEMFIEMFKISDELAKQRGFKFVDSYVKEEK